MEFCPNGIDQLNNSNDSITNTSDINNEVKKFTDATRLVTFITVCVEVGLGLPSLLCFYMRFVCCTKGISCSFACGGFARNRCLCFFHSESYLNAFTKVIQPFLMFDAIFILTVAPISNIHPFIVTCAVGYVLIALRLLSYVLTFALLFVFRYYKYNMFEKKRLVSLAFKMVGLILDLISISSSLATLIKLGVPEMPGIQISYATASIVLVILTYIT